MHKIDCYLEFHFESMTQKNVNMFWAGFTLAAALACSRGPVHLGYPFQGRIRPNFCPNSDLKQSQTCKGHFPSGDRSHPEGV